MLGKRGAQVLGPDWTRTEADFDGGISYLSPTNGYATMTEGELAMPKMRAMVHKVGGPLVAEERDIPVPGPGEMRIRVQACGVCHSDSVTVQSLVPGIQYPRAVSYTHLDVYKRQGRRHAD